MRGPRRPGRAGPQHKRHLKAVGKATLTVAELAAFDALRPREDLAALAASWADDAEFQALLKLARQPLPELDDRADVLTAGANLPDGIYKRGRGRLHIQRAKAQAGLARMRQLERAALTASATRPKPASRELVLRRTTAVAPVVDADALSALPDEAAGALAGASLFGLLRRAVDAITEVANRPPAPAPVVNVPPVVINVPTPVVNVAAPNVVVKAPRPAAVTVHVPQEKRPTSVRSFTKQGIKYFQALDEFGNVIGGPTDTAA